MKFLTFDCRKSFQTSGSVSYDLLEPTDQVPKELAHASVVSSVGTLELHYEADTHIRAYIRVLLPIYLSRTIDRDALRSATERFLQSQGLPDGVTYQVDLIPFDTIKQVSHRIDAEGKSDGIGS